MHKLILKTPDPAEQIVGIIIPQNYGVDPSERKNDSIDMNESVVNSSNINRIISSNQGRLRSERKQSMKFNYKKQYSEHISTPSE